MARNTPAAATTSDRRSPRFDDWRFFKYRLPAAALSDPSLSLCWSEHLLRIDAFRRAWDAGRDPNNRTRDQDRYRDVLDDADVRVAAARQESAPESRWRTEREQLVAHVWRVCVMHRQMAPRSEDDKLVEDVARALEARYRRPEQVVDGAWVVPGTDASTYWKRVCIGEEWPLGDQKDGLLVPMTLHGSRFYLGRPGGDYIFQYVSALEPDNDGAGFVPAADGDERRFKFQGLVPRPPLEYMRRFSDVVLPDVLRIVISVLAFCGTRKPSEPTPSELQDILDCLDKGSVQMDHSVLRLLRTIWDMKFRETARRAGGVLVPEFVGTAMRAVDGRVAEFAWLWMKLPVLKNGPLDNLRAILESGTGLTMQKVALLFEKKLEAEAKEVLFREKQHDGPVVVYAHNESIHDFYTKRAAHYHGRGDFHLSRYDKPIPSDEVLAAAHAAAIRIAASRPVRSPDCSQPAHGTSTAARDNQTEARRLLANIEQGRIDRALALAKLARDRQAEAASLPSKTTKCGPGRPKGSRNKQRRGEATETARESQGPSSKQLEGASWQQVELSSSARAEQPNQESAAGETDQSAASITIARSQPQLQPPPYPPLQPSTSVQQPRPVSSHPQLSSNAQTSNKRKSSPSDDAERPPGSTASVSTSQAASAESQLPTPPPELPDVADLSHRAVETEPRTTWLEPRSSKRLRNGNGTPVPIGVPH